MTEIQFLDTNNLESVLCHRRILWRNTVEWHAMSLPRLLWNDNCFCPLPTAKWQVLPIPCLLWKDKCSPFFVYCKVIGIVYNLPTVKWQVLSPSYLLRNEKCYFNMKHPSWYADTEVCIYSYTEWIVSVNVLLTSVVYTLPACFRNRQHFIQWESPNCTRNRNEKCCLCLGNPPQELLGFQQERIS
jgi:hypothetical protein